MKKEITLGQLLSVAGTLVIAMATGWITMQKDSAVTRQRVQTIETQMAEDKIYYRQAINELKWAIADGNQKTSDKLTELLVKMENKQNRK